jgi:putative DNA primase/helicase
MTMMSDKAMTEQQTNIVGFPKPEITDEENAKRIMAEATRLASLSPGEWKIWINGSAERLGITRETLEAVVIEVFKDREKKQREDKAEARRIEERAEKTKKEGRQEERQQEREQQRAEKEAARQAEQEQRRLEKEQARKEKERAKAFDTVLKLPVARHEEELRRLAELLGEDVAVLREELDELIGLDRGAPTFEKTEPWPEPVDAASVLVECSAKIRRYVVCQLHHLTASVLWSAHAWLYDYKVPIHSPMLAATSAEPDSGKSTLIVVVGRCCPRLSLNVEITGPNVYRFVDAHKPTMAIDEADDLFLRKSDLKHVMNAGWTRGWTIPRQVKINGVWQTVHFDPFCAKLIALLGRNLPPQTRSRCIELRLMPRRPDEVVEEFNQFDDPEFAILRRKFARFAADNAAALKDAKPFIPSSLNNRAAANWKLLLAIAELPGGDWPKQAREAAERISRNRRQPSDGVKLLIAIKKMFLSSSAKVLASKTIVAELIKDPTDIWIEYNHGGPITQRQVAHLLSAYDVAPGTVHPSGRSSDSPQGYKFEQFEDAFARFVPDDPHIHTPRSETTKQKPTPTKSKRRKKK